MNKQLTDWLLAEDLSLKTTSHYKEDLNNGEIIGKIIEVSQWCFPYTKKSMEDNVNKVYLAYFKTWFVACFMNLQEAKNEIDYLINHRHLSYTEKEKPSIVNERPKMYLDIGGKEIDDCH